MWEIYEDVCTALVSSAVILTVLIILIQVFIDIINWIKGGKNGQ